jgi:hypothetical protein
MAWAVIDSLASPTAGAFDFPALTLTGYKVIRVMMSAITVTTDGTDVRLTFYVGGSEITGTAYRWVVRAVSTSASGSTTQASGAASILLVSSASNFDVGNASTKAFAGEITVGDPTNTSRYKHAHSEVFGIGPTGNAIHTSGAGLMENAGAISGLKIGGTSNLVAGKVRVLGLT